MYSSQAQLQVLEQVMHHDAVVGAIRALIEGLGEQAPAGSRIVWSPGSVQTAIEDMQGAQHVFLVDPVLDGGGQIIFFFPSPLSSAEKENLDRVLGMAERWMHALFEMEQLEASLGHAASRDPLTGVLNARAYAARVGQLLQAGTALKATPVVMHLDLIQFKSVNDQLGDEMGDELLFAFADRVRKQIAAQDCFGRLGPDEFGLVFMNRSPGSDTTAFIEKFLRWVQKPPIETSHWHGVRIGIAPVSDQGLSARELLLAAANALRSTKVMTTPAYAMAGQSPQVIAADLL
jgi:diguanylate cyclase (GGDEF)-like protein